MYIIIVEWRAINSKPKPDSDEEQALVKESGDEIETEIDTEKSPITVYSPSRVISRK